MDEILISKEKIENLKYEIREKQVMLDSDLARLYECKNGTKDVNRNIERFPIDFYFPLTKKKIQKYSKVPKWNLRIRTM